MTVTESAVPDDRILFVIPAIGVGGAELQTLLQISAAQRHGLEISLLVLSEISDTEVMGRIALPVDQICELPNRSKILDRQFLFILPKTMRLAVAFAADQECTKVVAHMPAAHFFSRLLKIVLLLRGRRLQLYQYHHSEERRLSPLDTLGKRLFFGVNQLLARLCDHAHWHVSERVRADVAGGGFTRRDAVLHNTCDMDSPGDAGAAERLLAPVRARGKPLRSPYVVLVPGRLRSMKGHVLFLHALAQVCATEKIAPAEFQVVIAGEGDEREAIEAAIEELALGDRVTLTGEVAHPVLLALYGKVDLVVVPSLDEGFGIVAIEAISRRALVLASDAGGLREVLRHGENGFVFSAGDEDALVAELSALWRKRDEPLIDRDAARRDCAARFGMDAHIDRVLALLGV